LQKLKADYAAGNWHEFSFPSPRFQAMVFGQHLYQPLLHAKSDYVEVRPVALNER